MFKTSMFLFSCNPFLFWLQRNLTCNKTVDCLDSLSQQLFLYEMPEKNLSKTLKAKTIYCCLNYYSPLQKSLFFAKNPPKQHFESFVFKYFKSGMFYIIWKIDSEHFQSFSTPTLTITIHCFRFWCSRYFGKALGNK
jgi:hypothetical protein